jgi:SAM-dependent methyltransferase
MNKKLNLEQIRPYLLNPNISEKEIIRNILEISNKFTKNRSQIDDYVEEENLVSSYALFYLPTNVPKFEFVFSKLETKIKDKILKNTFIDVGCGPGTYSYAISQLGHQANSICIDKSRLMLKQADSILTNTFKNKKFIFQSKLTAKIDNSTLFFGNSINEMGIQNAVDIVNIVSPEIVMFIEPGTSELFVDLKKFRTWLLTEYDVLYPCPSNANCPNNWCHQVLRTTHDHDIERLSQLVSLDRKIMPMTAHVYIKKNKTEPNSKVTLIRYLNETKFSFIYEACEYNNNENINLKIEILKKSLSKDQEKYFKNANIGDQIIFIKDKLVGDTWRGHVN